MNEVLFYNVAGYRVSVYELSDEEVYYKLINYTKRWYKVNVFYDEIKKIANEHIDILYNEFIRRERNKKLEQLGIN